ncbi:hypothetical protein J6590_024752 [Homalodisca vitripennis]|nr:hypothetical protein J6590_024752 [Homalodisca vitripennis]
MASRRSNVLYLPPAARRRCYGRTGPDRSLCKLGHEFLEYLPQTIETKHDLMEFDSLRLAALVLDAVFTTETEVQDYKTVLCSAD